MPDEPIPPTMAAAFKPIDWSKSLLGRDLWRAWNHLDHTIGLMLSATPRQMTQAVADLDEARNAMRKALRKRDEPSV